MKIVLPTCVSDNHLYGMRGKTRFMYKEGKEWKENAQMIAKLKWKKKPTTKPLTMTINFYLKRDRDVHGSGKLIADSLEGIVYVNDKQIKKMIFEKFIDKDNPRIEIEIII